MCPYHGLRFDGAGRCIHNPHPGGQLPDAQLQVYPLVERHALLWIWMGDAALAERTPVLEIEHHNDPGWHMTTGDSLRCGCHYLWLVDNLLERALDPAWAAMNLPARTTGCRERSVT